MKKALVIIGLLISFISYSQSLFIPTDFYVCNKKREAKRIIKRFEKAGIFKDYAFQENQYYIELDEFDIDDYFIRFKNRKLCIPEKKRNNILTINMYNDDGTWNDEIILF